MDRIIKSKNRTVIFYVIFLVSVTCFFWSLRSSYADMPSDILIDRGNVADQVLYLSDIEYSKAQVGWGTVALDKTQDNTPLILKLDGYSTTFKKGIWAHATSTVEYDISAYKDYAYFTTYYGINTTGNKGNGVKFYVYTSVDGQEWTLKTEADPSAQTYVNNAGFVKVDIRDANYIRLYAHDNGSNGSDHAVWADSKLIKEGYTDDITIGVDTFDAYIKSRYNGGAIDDDLKLILLQRNFIKRVGQFQLRSYVDSNPEHKETLEWFIHNEDALRLYTMGGTPNGTYVNSLTVLNRLYHAHKEDLENEGVTANGTVYKDLYLRMMIALSLTHASNIGLWIGGNQWSDAVTRYEIYKSMHLNNELLSNSMFERYTVEEMRWLMHVNIDDEEIKWLRDYSLARYPNTVDRFSPYKYVRYTTGYSYHRPQYYSQENYAKWDQKYNLSKYNITYQYGKPKLWIVFEEGAVCGGISKTAANLYGVWGVPASVVGQPAHAAYIYYYEVGGKGAWQLSYNVAATGWANTSGYARMPNDWGNGNSGVVTNTATIKSASYFFLAQEAQNEYDKYEKSEFILLLQDVYKNDRKKLERLYRDALKEEKINWDAWLGLVNLYITDETKTEEDLINLAEEISETLTYHPLPMYDLTRRLGTKIKSPQYRAKLMTIQEKTLRQATKATPANTLQYKEVPVVAQALLGEIDSELATFSFNGTSAGKIVLSKQLQSTQVNWSYSLDGGTTWNDCFEHEAQLSDEEIASIDINKDIKIHISGLDYSAANIYTIDITKRAFPGGVISINDEEDRIFGATKDMEWSLNPSEGWNSFATTNPVFNGNVRVYVRVTAAGTQTASDPVYFTFTENNKDDTKWYIQSKNLSVVEVNATQSGNRNNVLDGNVKTYWRSKYGLLPAYITIKMDQPRYISGIDYVPDASAKNFGVIPFGRARNLNIYVSMDGKNWELAGSKNNLGDSDALKHIDLPEPKKGLFVKVECTSVYSGDYTTFTASVIKLYENVLVSDTPRADVNYNIVSRTNKDVVAELINPTRNITVTNNGGKTSYTFTQNGEFTFEYEDDDGNKGSTTARVDWIDKTPPTASVTYSTTKLTNEEVVATIKFDKEVTILSKDVQIAENPTDKSKTITFEENASYELEFADDLGNIGRKTIAVNWIDTKAPTAKIEYSTTTLTDQPVTATLVADENIKVTNGDGSVTHTFTENGEYTFEFADMAGNKATATATVSWIAKVPTYEITYSTKNKTNKDVDVTLTIEDGYRIVNNDANNTYTFKTNGTFEFQYLDSNSNVGVIPVTVDWIDKVPPKADLKYDKHKDKVIVTVINPSEEIFFKEGNGTYEYTENGEYEIIIYDEVRNEGKLLVIIDSIDNSTDQPGTEDPNDPGAPEKPSTPDEPNTPDKPSVPDEPEPENPGTSTKPENPDQTTPSKPTNPDSSKPNPDDKPNGDEEYKVYSKDAVTVKIPSDILYKEGTLQVDYPDLPTGLKGKFGNASIFYDIYLIDDKSEIMSLDSKNDIELNVEIDLTKEFIDIYEIADDGTIKPVNYTKDEKNIKLLTSDLGRYVVSYKDPHLKEEKNFDVYSALILTSCTICVVGVSIYIFKMKRNVK